MSGSLTADVAINVRNNDDDDNWRSHALRQTGYPVERPNRRAEFAAKHAPVAATGRGAMLAVVVRSRAVRMANVCRIRCRSGRLRHWQHELQRQGHRSHQRYQTPCHLLPPAHGAIPSFSCKRFSVCLRPVKCSLFYHKLKF